MQNMWGWGAEISNQGLLLDALWAFGQLILCPSLLTKPLLTYVFS